MLIGVDFDNTIVCYDALFHKVALEQNCIPADLPVNKSDVRNHLRKIGKEEIWTEMQGTVYGGRLSEAAPYPGVLEFFKACRTAGISVRIVSHKTRHPFLGKQYDLHQAALGWLEQHGFFDDAKIGLPRENVFFELTKQAKLDRIGLCGCTHFIDDLPEFLAEATFPANTHKILFDPNNLYAEEKITRLHAWDKATDLIGIPTDAKAVFQKKTATFLQQQGINEPFKIEPLGGGGNNRVYQVTHQQQQFALKEYFQNPADPRDRFGAEKSFYDFLNHQHCQHTPASLGWDTENKLGLFGFVEGKKLSPAEVNETFVREAMTFIVELNSAKEQENALKIPNASEACFSVAEHLACVERRIARLQTISCDSPIDQEAVAFVQTELTPAWKTIHAAILNKTGGTDAPITKGEKCLSPSDFGFHNALLAADGKLRFFDFEYAGWDDPAKLVCDFFCQPQIPVALHFWPVCINALSTLFPASFAERAALLLPAYQIKWCCIMLNEFVRHEQARRDFAKGATSANERKKVQLEKARHLLTKAIHA